MRGTAKLAAHIIVTGIVVLSSSHLGAAQVKVHQLQGAAGFLGGTFEGTRLDDDGALTLAPARERVAEIAEPFAFALATLPDGWAVGTGSDGLVLKVARDGTVTTLFDADEANVFALWADPDGTLFAGTSPDGRVYRIRDGRGEVWFDPDQTYIWAIARGSDGALWIATGVEGKLFKVGADGKGQVEWDSTEPHLRSLLPLSGGRMAIGTVGQGRVVERAADGAIRTLYDSSLAEVVALARGGGSDAESIYAAVLASEASFVELEPKGQAQPSGEGATAPDSDAAEGAAGTRAAGATGPRSELVRMLGDGIVQPLWSSQDETLFSLAASGSRLWLGTGAEGRLYSLYEDGVRFEGKFDERQIVALAADGAGPSFLTTNAAALYRTAAAREAGAARPRGDGDFVSGVADSAQPSRYGVLRWTGSKPNGTAIRAAFRFGMSTTPDDSWSEWSAPVELAGETGGESAIPAAPPSRFVQYRLDLTGRESLSPAVSSVEISYRQINQKPKIERFGAMDPGQILVPTNFNPSDQVYEPASPNRDGIFTSIEAPPSDGRTKTLWKRGMRTLRWRASDPNGDPLLASLAFRPESAEGAAAKPGWLEVATEQKEDYYGFDATALPDGRYRFRLRVSDSPANDPAGAFVAEEISEPVVIDHSPPRRLAVERRSGGRGPVLTLADDWNPIVKAELSLDAGEWRELAPVDGLADGRSERFDLGAIPRDAKVALLRVTDAAFNVTTFDLVPEIQP